MKSSTYILESQKKIKQFENIKTSYHKKINEKETQLKGCNRHIADNPQLHVQFTSSSEKGNKTSQNTNKERNHMS